MAKNSKKPGKTRRRDSRRPAAERVVERADGRPSAFTSPTAVVPPSGDPARPTSSSVCGNDLEPRFRQTPRQDTPPTGVIDLIDRIWVSLDFRGVAQVALLLAACAGAAVLIFGAAALAVHVAIGASPGLSAAVGAGTAAVGTTAGVVTVRRRRPRTSRVGQDG